MRQAKQALDEFSAHVVIHVFGPPMVGHVMQNVAMQMRGVAEAVHRAAASGGDVTGPR